MVVCDKLALDILFEVFTLLIDLVTVCKGKEYQFVILPVFTFLGFSCFFGHFDLLVYYVYMLHFADFDHIILIPIKRHLLLHIP